MAMPALIGSSIEESSTIENQEASTGYGTALEPTLQERMMKKDLTLLSGASSSFPPFRSQSENSPILT